MVLYAVCLMEPTLVRHTPSLSNIMNSWSHIMKLIVGFNLSSHSHCTSYIATQYIGNYIIYKHYIICRTKQLLLLSWKPLMIWGNLFLCLNYLRTCWIFKNRGFIKIKFATIITQQYNIHPLPCYHNRLYYKPSVTGPTKIDHVSANYTKLYFR